MYMVTSLQNMAAKHLSREFLKAISIIC